MTDPAKPDPQQVYRLHDMSVEEVSVVDRAANRRKFLLVKNEAGMGIGAEVKLNADGSLSAAKPAETSDAAAGSEPPPAVDAAKALAPEAKTAFLEVVESALDGLAKAKDILGRNGGEADILDLVVKTADDLADSVFAFLGIEGDGGNANLTKPVEAPEPPAGMGKRLEVRRAKRVVAEDAGGKAVGSLLAKVGAKMSKDRIDRFQAAYVVFGELLAEVLPKIDTDKAKGEPSMGHAEAGKPTATMPTVPEKKGTKKQHDPETQKALATAAATIKKQAEQLGALRDARQPSNGAAVEVNKGRSQDVSWPLDMNDPINAETSGKEFFG